MRHLLLRPPLRPGRMAQRGCSCLVTVLVLALVVACVLGVMVAHQLTRPVQASGPDDPVVIALSPAIPEAPHTTNAQGIFYRQSVEVNLPAGISWLASAPDGKGELCTDDQATFVFRRADGLSQRWTHIFSNADHRFATCLPPQSLTDLLAPGHYTVEITLEDRWPFTYGSGAYYLVIYPFRAARAETGGEITLMPSPSPLSNTPAANATTDQPQAPTRGLDVAPSLATPPAPTEPTGIAEKLRGMGWWPMLAVALAVASLLALGVWTRLWPQALPIHYLFGTASLFDTQTHESRTFALQSYLRGAAVTRQPLALVGIDSKARGTVVAQILPTEAGPLLIEVQQADGDTVQLGASYPLHHDAHYTLAGGQLTIHYRNPASREALRTPVGRSSKPGVHSRR